MALSLYSFCISVPHHRTNLPNSGTTRLRRRFDPIRIVRPGISEPRAEPEASDGTKVFVVSDLHTDYPENMNWVKSLSHSAKSVLLVAGDVAETYANFVLTMSLLKDRFEHVFFVPGNHDIWLRREKIDYSDSLDKMDKLFHACLELGVETKPSIVDGLGIVPLHSWYHESFDDEQDITGVRIPSLAMVINFLFPCM